MKANEKTEKLRTEKLKTDRQSLCRVTAESAISSHRDQLNLNHPLNRTQLRIHLRNPRLRSL